MKPIIAIGDIHGLDIWREIVERHRDCQFVFLGDYLDPFNYIPRQKLIDNLNSIINFKRSKPEDVVLLLGNHDLHYFNSDTPIVSRFDYLLGKKASRIFIENFSLFQYAYQKGNCIFTHAGISQKWFFQEFKGNTFQSIAKQLNNPSEKQVSALCSIGELLGGGKGTSGSIFWADKSELLEPLHGYTQVVGHNRVKEISVYNGGDNNQVIFCDCLYDGVYFYLE